MSKHEGKKHKKLIKSYFNKAFLGSSDARVLRILAEYLEPLQRLRKRGVKDTVVFYGSARMVSEKDAEKQYNLIVEKIKEQGETEELKKQLETAIQLKRKAIYYEGTRKLAYKITKWSLSLKDNQRFIVVSGGGPGIMEAANRGAAEAGGDTIGMNISLPFEQDPNPYITEELSFEFHYFFMRKFWFVFPAKAIVICPGGFGTMDEMFDLLTLQQTGKIKKPMCFVLYGSEYWNDVVKFDKLVEWGTISPDDLDLFHVTDDIDEAFNILKNHLEKYFLGEKNYWHW
ncbi:TIGR00730 family Rossman fold protein [candidate division KSB1 bacterium]|nr:TIGR00730 family Rossman fold protein [candidate division KSB1 bacterium]